MQQRCPNDNHGRAIVTVRFCPNCGVVVNQNILAMQCAIDKHAKMRRSRSIYCVDCGQGLASEGTAR
jgi:hypothetical protein